MNKARRKWIESVIEKLCDIQGEIEEIHCEEQDALDNIPESFMETERYETASEAVDNLDSAICSIEELIDYLTEAQGE